MSRKDDLIIEWVAKEYVVRNRGTAWYGAVVAVAVALVGLAIWMQYWSFLALVVVGVGALFVYVGREARNLQYKLSKDELMEGEKVYKMSDFRAFAVVQEGANFSVVLMPRKRFSIQARVNFPQDKGEEIVDMLGMRLPMEEIKEDLLDKIVKFLKI